MTDLFSPPPVFDLPLSRGGDLLVDFQNNPSGDGSTFVDWPVGVTVTLTIDTDVPVVTEASVSGYHASVFVPLVTADEIPARTKWSLVVLTPGSPDVSVVAANGSVVRFDGD